MANIYQPIVKGQSNWVDPLNAMLETLAKSTDDSGWIKISLLNGFTQSDKTYGTRIRKIGNFVIFDIAMSTITVSTVSCWIPTNLAPYGGLATMVRTTSGAPFGITIGQDGKIFVESSADRETVDGDYLRGVLLWMVD